MSEIQEEYTRTRHPLVIKVPYKTWDMFRMICKNEGRRPGDQIARFLTLLCGTYPPNQFSKYFEVEEKLYGTISSIQCRNEQKRERAKIIPFPIEHRQDLQ